MFKGGICNTSDTLYIYATSISSYISQVGSYLNYGGLLTPNKYQIVNNRLILRDIEDNRNITYIVETDTNLPTYIRCYSVINI